jgi:hypothetical protein
MCFFSKGRAAGFSMRLLDTLGIDSGEFAQITQEFVAEANRAPGIANVFTTFAASTPQVYVDVDRDKAQMLKVPVTNIFEAMRVFMGSAYVNDFNMFGRTYRVTAQADDPYRLTLRDVANLKTRSAGGEMVPIGSVATFSDTTGPYRVALVNGFDAWVTTRTGRYAISSQRYPQDVICPDGASRIEQFEHRAFTGLQGKLREILNISDLRQYAGFVEFVVGVQYRNLADREVTDRARQGAVGDLPGGRRFGWRVGEARPRQAVSSDPAAARQGAQHLRGGPRPALREQRDPRHRRGDRRRSA